MLLIGLDNYLGSNHPFYDGIPLYIKEDLTSSNIISDIAEQFAINIVPRTEYYTFLDKIIYYGNNINPESIEMIGNKKVKEIKDDDNITVELFPSDHFGLKCLFTNIN